VASLLLAELAARAKAEGETLYEKLDDLFRQHGCHSESQLNVQMPGEKGMEDMIALMAKFRTSPPTSIAGLNLVQMRDYQNRKIIKPGSKPKKLDGPKGDLVMLDLEGGNYVAVRPSGTEPKVKFYMFAFDPPGVTVSPGATVSLSNGAPLSTDLDAIKSAQSKRLEAMQADLKAFSGM